MVKKLMLAIAVLALATPSFAAVQNVKVGGDIATTSIIRDNFVQAGRQNEILAQTRLSVNADLTDNVSTDVVLLNENLWGNAAGNNVNGTVGLEYANVTLKEFMYAPLSLTIGRQQLAYGNKLIIGSSSYGAYNGVFSDLAYAGGFDAVKAVLSYNPLTIDLFAARVANNGSITSTGANGTHDNTNAYGVNANYKMGDKMSTVVEGYVFAMTDDNTVGLGSPKSENTFVPGLRVSINPIEGLNLQLEGAYQLGKVFTGTDDMANRNAFAIQAGLNYALPTMKDMKPVLGLQYTYLSGEKFGSLSGKNWDPMFLDQNAGRIFYALGMDSGVQRAALSAEITPVKDLTAKATATGIWDVSKTGANASRYEGTEGDLDLTYAYTEDVKFGVSAGYFFTGKAFAPGTKDASQLLSSVSVAF